MLTDLTICMPTNRDLRGSRVAIESLLKFSDETGCRVVISDNSADPDKQAAYAKRSSRLTYLVPPNEGAVANLLSALSPVTTRYVMPMGDDDAICVLNGRTPLDLSNLPPDVVAVRPHTEIWTEKSGVCRVDRFTIDAQGAGERMWEFAAKAAGDNSIYYSIFRSDVFIPLLRMFSMLHPTKGAYCDWSMTLAFSAAGRVLHDPAIGYRYDLGRWSSRDSMNATKAALFAAASLPLEAEDFSQLLLFIDSYILLMSSHIALMPPEREKALAASAQIALGTFVRTVREQPARYDDVVRYLVDMVIEEKDLGTAFILALMLADSLQAGLKDRYLAYYQAVAAPQTQAA